MIKVGDELMIKALWNDTTRYDKITSPVKVLGVKEGRSESGVLVEVKKDRGGTAWLDSNWFEK